MIVEIPGFKKVDVKNVVFDYNGTLAKDGKLKDSTKELLKKVCEKFTVFVITADTFGSVQKELKDFNLNIKILHSDNHTKEKESFIKSFKDGDVVSFGNGNNDALMLKASSISIAIIEGEGCSKEALLNSTLICKDIDDAINLLLNPKRLIATLRK